MTEANNCFVWKFLLLSAMIPTSLAARDCKYFDKNVCVEKLLRACKLFVLDDTVINGNLCVRGRICNTGLTREIIACCDTTNENIDFTRQTILDSLSNTNSSACEHAIVLIESCCEATNSNIDYTRETILDDLIVLLSKCDSLGGDATIDCSVVEGLSTCESINGANFTIIQWLKSIFYILNHQAPD